MKHVLSTAGPALAGVLAALAIFGLTLALQPREPIALAQQQAAQPKPADA